MNKIKLAVTMVIFYLCCGMAMAAGSIDQGTVHTVVYAPSPRPETTSMLLLDSFVNGSYLAVTNFDGELVDWASFRITNRFNYGDERGVIVPSGRHTLACAIVDANDKTVSSGTFAYDFQPGGFYVLTQNSLSSSFSILDYTNTESYSNRKAQMEKIIQQ